MFAKLLQDSPREIFNFRLWFCVLVFGLMGAARGLDEGLIGTTASLPSFSKQFHLHDAAKTKIEQANILSNITSMIQLGSIIGAIVGFYLTDRLGRLWATRELCVLWMVGIAIFLSAAANGSLGLVYAGRLIAGIGIGQTTVVAPTYLAEVAPRSVRGLCVCIFSGSVYLGTMLGYFACYGAALHVRSTSQIQWVLPNLIHVYFATAIFVLSFFAVESPRWLQKVGKQEQAESSLAKIRNLPRNHPYIQAELLDVRNELECQREAMMGTSGFAPIRELLVIPANRYRLMLSVMTQLLSQWSGSNGITIYAVDFFALVGITGSTEKLLATAIFGLVKFLSAMICAIFLIDMFGRKRSLMSGIVLQFIALLYVGLFLLLEPTIGSANTAKSASQRRASTGAVVMIYLSGFGFALGWNSAQYLVNAEIYPLRLRAMGASLAMTFHFVNQYGNSKAVPEMLVGLTPGGTMIFFAATVWLGGAWVWFFMPELSGRSLESVDAVFRLRWWQIGRHGKRLASDPNSIVEHLTTAKDEVELVERVETTVDHQEDVPSRAG